jgi:peptide/nickel transport system permease protein
LKGYRGHFQQIWLVCADLCLCVCVEFFVAAADAGGSGGGDCGSASARNQQLDRVQAIYQQYTELFGTNKPLWEQFIIYVQNVLRGDFGFSFSQYPRDGSRRPWRVDRVDADVAAAGDSGGVDVGQHAGGIGCVSAWGLRQNFDALFDLLSSFPPFGMAVILLVIFAVQLRWFPTSGGYGFDLIPSMTPEFLRSGGGPLSAAVLVDCVDWDRRLCDWHAFDVYADELNADYVKFSRFMGLKDSRIAAYVFRNAMLPQVTGLALALGTMVGALIAENHLQLSGVGHHLVEWGHGAGLSAHFGVDLDHHLDGVDGYLCPGDFVRRDRPASRPPV